MSTIPISNTYSSSPTSSGGGMNDISGPSDSRPWDGYSDAEIEQYNAQLRAQYDSFTAKYIKWGQPMSQRMPELQQMNAEQRSRLKQMLREEAQRMYQRVGT